jgi:dihydrofolate reductase
MNEYQPKLSIIAAMDSKRGIGRGNKLLFRIRKDFERMTKLRGNHPIIMGRNTHESILNYTKGEVLPGGTNFVVTHDPNYQESHDEGCVVCHSLDDAIDKASNEDSQEIIIFGGANIYKQALPRTDKLYLTVVEGDFNADKFFPDYREFKKILFEEKGKVNGLKYKFLDLER